MSGMSTGQLEDFSELQIDLHSHTTCSDGKLSPQELIERAVNYQIDVLAITDHDTVDAIDSAKNYILEKKYPLELISGIEVSTDWKGFEIHVVGLNLDYKHPSIAHLINAQQNSRESRAVAMGEKLEKCGFIEPYAKAKAMAGNGTITRTHFARVLQEQEGFTNLQTAFDKYIGKGKRAYVKPNWCSIKEAVSTIHQAGGSAVLAHPIRYDLSAKWLRRLIVDFKNAQGDALEVVLPQMNNDQRRLMLNYCLEYDLHASMGSDFHFPTKWRDLGRNLRMPEGAKPVWLLWN